VESVAQLVRIAGSLPRSSIEAKSADARGRLLRLGAPACGLDAEQEQPIADWSPALQDKLVSATSHSLPALPAIEAHHHESALPEPSEAAPPEATETAPPATTPKVAQPEALEAAPPEVTESPGGK
jgi:hypothetical protein